MTFSNSAIFLNIFCSESESRSCGGGMGGGAAAAGGGGGGGALAAGGGGGGGGAGPPAAAGGGGDGVELVPPLRHSHPDSHLAAQQPHQPVTIENTATNTSSQSFRSKFTIVAIISFFNQKGVARIESFSLYYDKHPRNLRKFTDYGPEF